MGRGILFVEGADDEQFLASLLLELQIIDVEIEQLKGNVEKIPSNVPRIRQRIDEGKLVGIVLDMDQKEKNYDKKLSEFVENYNLSIEDWFLMPNNLDEGDLETLLLQMTVPQHAHVERCFEEYTECLKLSSYFTPDRKGRVYAYCEAIGVKAKGSERDYADRGSWNLDATALKPLKEFLVAFAGSALLRSGR